MQHKYEKISRQFNMSAITNETSLRLQTSIFAHESRRSRFSLSTQRLSHIKHESRRKKAWTTIRRIFQNHWKSWKSCLSRESINTLTYSFCDLRRTTRIDLKFIWEFISSISIERIKTRSNERRHTKHKIIWDRQTDR